MLQQTFSVLERYGPSWLKNLVPEKWRIWLGYQIKVRLRKAPAGYQLRQPMTIPAGYTRNQIFNYLAAIRAEGTNDEREIVLYLNEACDRYLYTLNLVPKESGRMLDIGASPYHLTMLVRKFRDYETSLINYFGESVPRHHHDFIYDEDGTKIQMEFANVNVEVDSIPHDDNSFDVVLLCEVIEHFVNDPVFVLSEIKRVLKPGGTFVMSTPNVTRLENISRLISDNNLYDPYSGYGPYGRHNREYTMDELKKLVEHVGFEVTEVFTSDVHANQADYFFDTQKLQALLAERSGTLGQYIFIQAKNQAGDANQSKPRWLYRSYDDEAYAG
ncbi:MAG: methyltransferase domain-containing protein [Chloroflexota bacterium]